MAINKVVYGADTLVDLTEDTVTAEDVLNSKSFHTSDGVKHTGTASYPVTDVQVNGTSVMDGTVAKVEQPTADEQTAVDEFETYNGGLLSSLKVALSPNQDLHGYDSPWVGGAGKNKLPMTLANIIALNTDGTWNGNTYTFRGIDYTVLVDDANNIIGFDTNGIATQRGWFFITEYDFGETDAVYNNVTVNGYIFTAGNSAYIANQQMIYYNHASKRTYFIMDGITTNHEKWYPMVRLSSESDTTFEPYSNICPISGHTQAKVGDDGKNRIPYVEFGILNQTDGSEEANNDNKRTGFIYVPKHGNYTISGLDGSNIAIRIFEYDKNKNYIRNYLSVTFTGALTIITNENVGYVRFQGNKVLFASDTAQLEEGSTATAYVPYNGYQVTVNLGGTYYSGTLDVVSGVFTPDTAVKEYDGSADENWSGNASWNNHSFVFPNTLSDAVAVSGYDTVANIECNLGIAEKPSSIVTTILSQMRHGIGQGEGSSLYANISDDLDTVAKFKTFLSTTPLQVRYYLANPTPIQLSPTMVKALVGENHLSAPLEGQEITESKYRELFTLDEVEEIAQKIADSKIDNIYTSYDTTFSSAFTEARYVKKIYGAPVLTALQIVLSGAPSITFNHQLIFSDSQTCCELIQFGSGARIGITDVAISQGSVTFTFDSPLTKAIGFRCRITNDFVS